MKHNLIFILALIYAIPALARIDEGKIAALFDSLRVSETDSLKNAFNEEIRQALGEALNDEASFDYPFSQVANLGKIYSDDKNVRIYTWSFPYTDRTNGYGGFIQFRKKGKVTTTPLLIKTEAYLPSKQGKISTDNWYGALYYKVIRVKKRGEDYYVALGWAGYNAASDFKLMETITFDGRGKPSFGKMVFDKKGKNDSRVTLEYSAEAKITLNYDESSKRIIFDHLSPIEPGYKDIRVYYGPDFTYDAYLLKKGIWYLEENIDARNAR